MKRRIFRCFTGILTAAALTACASGAGAGTAAKAPEEAAAEAPAEASAETTVQPVAAAGESESEETAQPEEAAAYAGQDSGVTYEIFVYSFCDSDGDGIGDLGGVRQKLGYIANDLGCSAIWLTPVFPSPTYHKYDALDYYSIDPQFGSMEDFEGLVSDCHEKGLRLYMDLAVNHTSDAHPWFLKAADEIRNSGAADGEAASMYNFSPEQKTGYAPLSGSDWFYEARFWSGMPDLNLSNEKVRQEIKNIADFWLDKGVDGFRLDAVTSYYTDSSDESEEFLSWLTKTVKEKNPDAYLVGEIWTDQNTYARYYGTGIDSVFDFAFAGPDGIIASVVKGSRGAAVYPEALAAEEALYAGYNPEYINAPFYTNHDMARSAGYYAYDDGSRTKLAGALNLLMPGNVFIYYGEEIGMKGSGKDENKRAPMQWKEGAPGSDGMCQGPPDMDAVSMKFAPLEEQMADPQSVWTYYRDAVLLRKQYPVIAQGRTRAIPDWPEDRNLCAFVREPAGDEKDGASPLMIIINTGEEAAEIDINSCPEDMKSICAQLNVSGEKASLDGGILRLPAFGIAVLK